MIGLMQDWPLRLHRIIDYAAAQYGAREVVSRMADGSLNRTTYGAIRAGALRLAARLAEEGVVAGDRVATLAWNSATHMEIWYGVAGLGAVYHTVNPRLFPDQVAWIINHARGRVLFVESCFLPLVQRIAGSLPALARIVVLGAERDDEISALPRAVRFEDWIGGVRTERRWAAVAETTAAGLCYTSGTTGEPKGVLYSHRSTLLHAMMIAGTNAMAVGAADTVLPIVPMFHVNAWGLPFAAPMVGAKLVMPGARLDGASLYDLMEGEGVTHAAGVPTVWIGLLDHLRRSDLTFTTFRRLFVGGSACPPALIEAFERDYGVEVCHLWGMTETSPVATICMMKGTSPDLSDDDRRALKRKQGYAAFGVEMTIVDGDGAALPQDGATFGRLLVKGCAVTSAYYGQATTNLDPAGFFDTGDVATIDPQGYMQIVDRTKDVIKSGGEWISSIAIENLAMAHPDVSEAAVIGVSHPKWGERPLLVLVGRDGIAPSRDDMRRFLESKMARWWIPDDVQVIAELPHTATGKVSKKALRALFFDYRLPVEAEAG